MNSSPYRSYSDKMIALRGGMYEYEDDSDILSLTIKCFGITNVSVQRKTGGKIGQPAQRHCQNGMENINLQNENNFIYFWS